MQDEADRYVHHIYGDKMQGLDDWEDKLPDLFEIRKRAEIWEFLDREEFPLTNQPVFSLHVEETEEFMGLKIKVERNYATAEEPHALN